LDKARGLHTRDSADCLQKVVGRQPGVELLQGAGETIGEDDVSGGGAPDVELLGREVGVAKALEVLDGWGLGEGLLVPASAGGGHRRAGRIRWAGAGRKKAPPVSTPISRLPGVRPSGSAWRGRSSVLLGVRSGRQRGGVFGEDAHVAGE